MSWEQLGLFLSAQSPKRLSPKAKAKAKAKPIKKAVERHVKLKPGELDDSLDGVFPD